jgi:Flp pilus assembly pilin Flp
MMNFIARFLRDDEGQDLVEYVLLISLVALLVVTAFPALRDAITSAFTNVGARISASPGS